MTTPRFDRGYWESHWQQANGTDAATKLLPNPALVREVGGLLPGRALEAGCGEGAEAIWLADRGWQVTAADISTEALSRARERAAPSATSARVQWVEADLAVWEPGVQFDLVATHYAHPAMAQLPFYQRLSGWVAPGGTLLIVGHLLDPDTTAHGHGPPEAASVTAATVTAALDATCWDDSTCWDIVTAEERDRTLVDRAGHDVPLRDVVVRAVRSTPGTT